MGAVARKIKKSVTSGREYAPYLEAAWGIKNHWYPALFSEELPENFVKGVMICGHEIALRRARGKAYALRDRCAHRGVRISKKSMCLTDQHLTCWYHGFTYGLEDGVLRTILASPDDAQIGRVRIRTYPVEELNGIIFVFVGDEEFKPVPPISSDLPIRISDDPTGHPIGHLLDPNVYVRGIHRTGNSNWRLAVENGFDPGHVLVHYDNILIAATDRKLVLGLEPISPDAIRIIDEPNGPKGFMNMYNRPDLYKMIFENQVANIRAYGKQDYYARTSAYLPSTLLVEHWPAPNWAQVEFYVPIDDKHHEYWEVVVGHCDSEEDRKEADFKYANFFEPLALREFNDRDLFARAAMQDYYAEMDGWNGEKLCALDNATVAWRKIVSQFNRGIQESQPVGMKQYITQGK